MTVTVSNVSLWRKVLFVVLICFCVRLMFSCIPGSGCGTIEFSFNTIHLDGIDNSGMCLGDEIDTMSANAVCIKLTLSDSLDYYYACSKNQNSARFFPFSSAYADCSNSYQPSTEVDSIKIITLFDIDDELKSGENIDDVILFSNSSSGLYEGQEWAISELNRIKSDPEAFVYAVLTTSVQNTEAKFCVEVSLGNGTVLSDTTHTFSIN